MTNEMSNDQCPNPKEAPIPMLQSLPRDECLGFENCLELGPWALGILERGFLWSLVFGIWCLPSLASRLLRWLARRLDAPVMTKRVSRGLPRDAE
jgi:hypothetical protein